MITIDQIKYESQKLKEELVDLEGALNLINMKNKLQELSLEQEKEDFWQNIENAQLVNKEKARIENKIRTFEKLKNRYDDLMTLIDLCLEENSNDELEEIDKEYNSLSLSIEEMKLDTLLTGKYDANNAIISIHPGAGGTESQDWTEMLYRMYTRYAERHGFKIEVLDYLAGDVAGIKSVTFQVNGDNAYGYLKTEKGIHRLVRISPFNSEGKRMTSFTSVEVMPEILDTDEIKINPDEIRIDTYRSSGAGGQHVNKTDSAIRITHFPTGIVVTCQNERSQAQNKEKAFQMLMSKLIERKEQERAEKESEIKGEIKKIEWGNQIRSYVFCPYTMVKDLRTGYETGNVSAVMDGDIDAFIFEYLKKSK